MPRKYDEPAISRLREKMIYVRDAHMEAVQMVFSAMNETNDKDKIKRLREFRDKLIQIKYPESPL